MKLPRAGMWAGIVAGCILLGAIRGDAQRVRATGSRPPTGFASVVTLWPEGAPLAHGKADGDVPKLFCYPVAVNGMHSAVIVLPGGGYTALVMEKEGAAEARWLNAQGVAAFVLEYRLSPAYRFPAPMLDGARAVRYVRSHAAELGLAPDRIGVWGFSAGGHLAGYLATTNDAGRRGAADPVERANDRPDFAILSYARLSLDNSIPREGTLDALIGRNADAATVRLVSDDLHVTRESSPSLIYATTADAKVNSLSATAFYDAMQRAGAPVELHIFERGVHGTGMGQNVPGLPELGVFATILENWMTLHGWMAAK